MKTKSHYQLRVPTIFLRARKWFERRSKTVVYFISLFRRAGLFGVIESLVQAYLHLKEERWLAAQNRNSNKVLNVPELLSFLRNSGISKGDTIMVASSWDAIRNSETSPAKLIEELRNLIGPTGTLAMPAWAAMSGNKQDYLFKVDTQPTTAGIINETLRRTPGVRRSCNPFYSVCAIGPQAEFLLDHQHKSRFSWDEFCPYLRIVAVQNSWFVGIGVGPAVKVATSHHVIESILINHPFFRRLYSQNLSYEFISKSQGSGRRQLRASTSLANSVTLRSGYADKFKEADIGDVTVYAIKAYDLVEATLKMALRGRTMYAWPIRWPWMFWSSRSLDAKKLLDEAIRRVSDVTS
jgi:aminoglycoside 3-N-acetyltransferase